MENRVITVDVETGGLNPDEHALLEVAAFDGEEMYHSRVRAVGRVTPQALRVNAFTVDDVYSHRHPEMRIVMRELVDWLNNRRPYILAGYNLPFDLGFLHAACQHCRVEFPYAPQLDVLSVGLALHLARFAPLQVRADGAPRLSLDAVAREYGLQRREEVHHASEDAVLTWNLLWRMLQRMGNEDGS